MAPQHNCFIRRDFNIPVHFHHISVIICYSMCSILLPVCCVLAIFCRSLLGGGSCGSCSSCGLLLCELISISLLSCLYYIRHYGIYQGQRLYWSAIKQGTILVNANFCFYILQTFLDDGNQCSGWDQCAIYIGLTDMAFYTKGKC